MSLRKRTIRLAILTSGIYPFETHGAEIGIFYLAKRLAGFGYEVTLYLSEFTPKKRPIEKIELPKGLKLVYSSGSPLRFFYNVSFIARSLAIMRLRQNRPALLIVNIPTLLSLATAYLAHQTMQVPYLVIIHGPPDLDVGPKAIQRVQCFLIGRATQIVCVSRDLEKAIGKKCQTLTQSIEIIPNGYDRREIQQALESSRNAVLGAELVFVGSLDPNKDPLTLLRSFKLVSRSLPEARLNIVGRGPLESEAHKFVEKEQLQSRVVFHPLMSHSELLQLLARCSLLVITSRTEGIPTVAIESLALGRPVVATSAGGLAEIIMDGINGFLVPVGGEEPFAEAVLKILRDTSLRTRLSSGAERSAATFEWGLIAKSYDDLFKSFAI